MKTAVIGAGVVGVTTAYYLNQLGAEVEVFEAASDAATETSHCNAGQLSYSFTDAMADPALLARLLPILLAQDEGLRIVPSLRPSFVLWSINFLREASRQRSERNSSILLKTALESAELMQGLADEVPDFGYHTRGKLVLVPNKTSNLIKRIKLKQELGHRIELISATEAQEIEPAIRSWNYPVGAAVYSPDDELGDARRFTLELAGKLQQRGVRFHYSTPVKDIQVSQGRCSGIVVADTLQPFDAVVVCAGNTSRQLMQPLGINLKTLPVAGYSVNLPPGKTPATTSITALDKKVVVSRFDDHVRISGFADINLREKNFQSRLNHLRRTAETIAPEAADYSSEDTTQWTGFRCMTPSSVPIVGETKHQSLYVNTGHGMFGWTLAAATGLSLAREVVVSPAEAGTNNSGRRLVA